ncbi:hypothetical protein USB125703_01807 [Pseudoclavibacter triregionum]|nr:hypothetical protein USB125703_01807 [Pseudoclavibacter triregionum]
MSGRGGRSARNRTLLGALLGSALLMVGSAVPWVTVRGELAGSGPVDLSVAGETAAPAILAFGIAGAALALALLIAGPLFRRLLGGLAVLLGVVAVWQTILPMLDPVKSAAPAVREATGLSDLPAVRAAVPEGAAAIAPGVALGLLGGLVLALAGVLAMRAADSWGGRSRRFEDASSGAAAADGPDAAPRSRSDRRIAQWDALSHGDDPTDGLGELDELAELDGEAGDAPDDAPQPPTTEGDETARPAH